MTSNIDNNKGIEIYKLAKKYASTHYQYHSFFGNYEDYVQELVLAVLKRFDKYDEEKGSLSTFCYVNFKNRIIYEIVYQNRVKRYHKEISFNVKVLNKSDSNTIEEMIDDGTNLEEEIENKIILDEIKEGLDEVINLYSEGYNIREIANKLNITHQAVSQRIIKFKRDLDIYLKTGDKSNLIRRKNWGNLKEAREKYCKEHNISIRTYFRRKKNNTLNQGE